LKKAVTAEAVTEVINDHYYLKKLYEKFLGCHAERHCQTNNVTPSVTWIQRLLRCAAAPSLEDIEQQ